LSGGGGSLARRRRPLGAGGLSGARPGLAGAPAVAPTLALTTAAGPQLLFLGAGDAVALGHHLALVNPALDADPPGGGARLDEAVVDVGAQRVQGDAAVRVALGARHLGAA